MYIYENNEVEQIPSSSFTSPSNQEIEMETRPATRLSNQKQETNFTEGINMKIPCACGCGQLRDEINKWGVKRKYINGHNWNGKKHTKETKLKMRLNHPDISGKNHPFYGKKRPQHSKIMTGENNPSKRIEVRKKLSGSLSVHWKGGLSFEPYGLEFNKELKEEIRKRDNKRCQECFRHQDELFTKTGRKYKLHIHHIDFDKKNNTTQNLISLCRNCHLQTNHKREDWIKYFQEKIMVIGNE